MPYEKRALGVAPGLRCQTAQDGRLFQSGLNAREGSVEFRADAYDNGNDRDRDAGGDQAILDGRGSLFVCKKSLQRNAHVVCRLLSARSMRRPRYIESIFEGFR